MSAGVLWLGEVGAGDGQAVGGKAANLGELLRQGFPVPNGFVVTADSYARAFQALRIESKLAPGADAEDIARACAEIRARIEGEDLPAELAEAILSAHAALTAADRKILCAVRSSATAEDLGAASFAGQHGTYYYVDGEHLLMKVKQCWTSLWSVEAASYRATHGIADDSVAMAVVVQEMIPSDVAGVAFTANPVTGAPDAVVIEASWGMGAAIVDGRVTPDHYAVSRDGMQLRDKRIAEKCLMVSPRLEAGQEARLEQVPNDLRLKETLTPTELTSIAEWSLRAEAHFSRPQDVEWALHAGRFYLLQSRPITVLGREDVAAGVSGKYVLFKPLFENFTDPVTPLAQDTVEVWPVPGFRFIRGWLYMDIDRARPLIPFHIPDQAFAALLFSMSKDAPQWPLAIARVPFALFSLLMLYLVMAVLFVRSKDLPDDALDGYRAACERMEQDQSFPLEETLGRLFLFTSLTQSVADMTPLVNLSSIRFHTWILILGALLRRWAPSMRADAAAILASGTEGVRSAEMGRGIWALAQEARKSARVRDIFRTLPPERILGALNLEPDARAFLDKLQHFLAVNGHRALKEFELRAPRWREDPSMVLGMVRNYVMAEGEPLVHETKAAEQRQTAIAELREQLAGLPFEKSLGLRSRLILKAAERVRYFMKLRENTRFYHIMAFGAVRKKILKIEAELMRDGRLKCRDDIFFLRHAELAALRSGALGWLDVEDRVRERRIAHIRLAKMGPPRTIGIELEADVIASSAPDNEDAAVLRGQAASPGRFAGRARVILDPSTDARIEPGDILIAPYTDPAWTPLFLTAGAAVVEVGSYLSHAGTVAREFGMPCVVDVAGATGKIRSGDRVEVDGERGTVRILDAGRAAQFVGAA